MDGDRWSYRETGDGPPARSCFGWVPVGDGLVIFGGFSTLGELLATTSAWENLLSLPYGLGCPAATLLGEQDVLLFGGIEGRERFSGETLIYEP